MPFAKPCIPTLALAALMLAMLILAPVSSADAQGALAGDPDAPIEIQADNLEVFRDQQVAVFIGNVDAQQGRMNLRTDQLRVTYREGDDGKGEGAAVGGRISKLEAVGNVQVSTEKERATGERGVYDIDSATIVLEGGVRLFQDRNVLTGQRLVMNLETGITRLDGAAGAGGRVKGIFQPQRSGQTQ
ncbi:MAG: lipopolysaccharide transport periplasmic protein LptA [Minwuia sp.]|nr:lipopolysaccharide transport periplasmic protein LptA [Minwuia sp.]